MNSIVRSDISAFEPFTRKCEVKPSDDEQKSVEMVKHARNQRKISFCGIRQMFKSNVSRVLPCL